MLVLGSVTLRKILLLDQFIAWKHSICIKRFSPKLQNSHELVTIWAAKAIFFSSSLLSVVCSRWENQLSQKMQVIWTEWRGDFASVVGRGQAYLFKDPSLGYFDWSSLRKFDHCWKAVLSEGLQLCFMMRVLLHILGVQSMAFQAPKNERTILKRCNSAPSFTSPTWPLATLGFLIRYHVLL